MALKGGHQGIVLVVGCLIIDDQYAAPTAGQGIARDMRHIVALGMRNQALEDVPDGLDVDLEAAVRGRLGSVEGAGKRSLVGMMLVECGSRMLSAAESSPRCKCP
nr:hypothetical protein [Ectothiorhodospira marina]